MSPKPTFCYQPVLSSTTSIVARIGPPASLPRTSVRFRFLLGLFVALLLLGLPYRSTTKAQEERKPKVPVLDKISTGGPSYQQFSGVVRSVDLANDVLNVDNIKGNTTEMFPIKKKVRVVTADGEKLKLAKLQPGASVLINYEQKGDHKVVTEIVVLAGGEEKKKKTPPS